MQHTTFTLENLPQNHATLIGIDSDGCVFDTMAVKQRQFFFPLIVKFWHLEPITEAVYACAQFVNLTSKSRGSNRFPALLKVFELLPQHPQTQTQGITLPDTGALRAYVQSQLPLGNPSLQDELARTQDPELQRLLNWSLAINAAIASDMQPVPPFKHARRALALIAQQSDALVVSQTPEEALIQEWQAHDLRQYVYCIAGQESGTKAQHLDYANRQRYPWQKVLLIGDAMGDLAAARATGACFYPILPGAEEESWEYFCHTAYTHFLNGTYHGTYQQTLIERFEHLLLDTPPWQ